MENMADTLLTLIIVILVIMVTRLWLRVDALEKKLES